MTAYLRKAPTWVVCAYMMLLYAIGVLIALPAIEHGWHWTSYVPWLLIAAPIFGAIMGPITARRFRALDAAVGPLSDDDFRAAARAATRGQLPTDPIRREATAAYARYCLTQLNRIDHRITAALAILLATVACGFIVVAFLGTLWDLAQATIFAMIAASLAHQLWLRRTLADRLARLAGHTP